MNEDRNIYKIPGDENQGLSLGPVWQRMFLPRSKDLVFKNKITGLFVRYEQVVLDGKKWVHLVVGRKSKIPSYKDCVMSVNTFIGKGKGGFITISPDVESVNEGDNDLHIWSGDPKEMFSEKVEKIKEKDKRKVARESSKF